MGQQQLLLLILVIVAVGTAVTMGLEMFSTSKSKMHHDVLVAEGTRIISDIQAWKARPAAYGGGQAQDFREVSFEDIGLTQHAVLAAAHLYFHENTTGCFVLATEGTDVPPGGFLLGAYTEAVTCEPVGTLEGTLFSNANAVAVVTGFTARDIRWYTPQQYLTAKTMP